MAPPEPAPDPSGWSDRLRTVEQLRADGIHGILRVMRIAALLLVGAACSNLLFRTLDRATAHRPRLQLRTALGAAPGRILREELRGVAAPIALCAGGGALVGMLLLRLLAHSWPGGAGRWSAGGPDAASLVLGVAAPAGLLMLCIAVPARAAATGELARTLRVGALATPGPFQMLLRGFLARAQFAASLALAAGAGLLLRSVEAGDRGAAGPAGIQTVAVPLAGPDAVRAARLGEALRRARAGASGRAAAFATTGAWSGEGPEEVVTAFCRPACVDGGIFLPVIYRPARIAVVSDGHFALLGIRVLAGRPIEARDRAGAEPVAVVSRSAANLLFPRRPAVGQRLAPRLVAAGAPRGRPLHRVVGVVDDRGVPGAVVPSGPMVYLSAPQHPPRAGGIAFRAEAPPPGAEPLAAVHARLTAPGRWSARVLALLGAAALALCGYGLHGLVAAAMAARTREIGVRMALGAGPRRIFRLALGEALRIARAGILVGSLLSLAVAGVLRVAFAAVPWMDPWVLAAAAAALSAVALAACWRPAARAAATEPTEALRRG